MRYGLGVAFALGAAGLPLAPALCQTAPASAASQVDALSAELESARAEIRAQRRLLEAQESRLRALEARMGDAPVANRAPAGSVESGAQVAAASPVSVPGNADVASAPVERVGEAPVELEMPAVAVLGDQGSVVTSAGRLTAEASFEYARADRNRFLFRGIGAA